MDYVTNNRLWLYGFTSPSQASDRFNTIIQSLLCLTEYCWNLKKKIQTVVWDAKGLAGEVMVYIYIIPMNVWWLINYTAAGFKSIMSRPWDYMDAEYDNEIKNWWGQNILHKKNKDMKKTLFKLRPEQNGRCCGEEIFKSLFKRKFKFHWHWFKWWLGSRVGGKPLTK